MMPTKTVLADIPKCYATTSLFLKGTHYIAFAGEGEGKLQLFSGTHFAQVETLWEGGGGIMSIVPVPGNDTCFFVSRGFYSMVLAETSTIEIVRKQGDSFTHAVIASMPFLHRFSTLRGGDGKIYLLAATIATSKESKEDWSKPGRLYVAPLPDDLSKEFSIVWEKLPGAYFKNHGFFRKQGLSTDIAFTCSEEGVFEIIPPSLEHQSWNVNQILNRPASDVAVLDVDGDGEDEFAVIHPFHGDQFVVYKKKDKGYKLVYSYPFEQSFYHGITAGTINGKAMFIGGARRGLMQLFAIAWDKAGQHFCSHVIDQDVGPSNVAIMHFGKKDILLSANRQIDQAAIYEF